MRETAWHAEVSAFYYAHVGDIGSMGIRRVYEDLLQVKPAHALLLFHAGEITPDAWEEIRVRELEGYVLPIPLHYNLAKRLIIMQEVKRRRPELLDERVFRDAAAQLYKVDIDIERKVEMVCHIS